MKRVRAREGNLPRDPYRNFLRGMFAFVVFLVVDDAIVIYLRALSLVAISSQQKKRSRLFSCSDFSELTVLTKTSRSSTESKNLGLFFIYQQSSFLEVLANINCWL